MEGILVAMGIVDDYSFGQNDHLAVSAIVGPLAMVLVARVMRGS